MLKPRMLRPGVHYSLNAELAYAVKALEKRMLHERNYQAVFDMHKAVNGIDNEFHDANLY